MSAIDLALGIFFGWFLIRFWLKFCDGWAKLEYSLNKYFEMKDLVKNTLKDQK